MKYALVNPNWDFAGSTYFGCREPHYPLELMFAADKIHEAGGEALLLDAHNQNWDVARVREKVLDFAPDFLVMPTAPTYLFWRCPQPELRVPQAWFAALKTGAIRVAIGPHASATPATTIRKTGCEVVLRGEPDQTLSQLASTPWSQIDGCCWRRNGDSAGNEFHVSHLLGSANLQALGALHFAAYDVERRRHRHHVFQGEGRGAELEFARGCPWSCSFCNKTLFRDRYRERPVEAVLQEVDRLISRGVDYVYFIDEIFGVGKNVKRLLQEIAQRDIRIGLQTRIDLWDEESLELLGRAHCISMECGVESITAAGRENLNKNCRIGTDRIRELLLCARRHIPWVQANLILTQHDDRSEIRAWQEDLKSRGVWVSEPVPMYPYPGTPLYRQLFGEPDETAWERAHHYYTAAFRDAGYSDIQEQQPADLEELECTF
jgi:anaerobic magnesium-protoporphyrin IX monomethyl ester cyclase